MTISMLTCRLAQPLINVPSCIAPKLNLRPIQKEKVVLVMGATGTGKSRLSIDLATCFQSEIINSDKIQVYEGLDIVTNKISKQDQSNVPHHLLGTQNPNKDFTPIDFCDMSLNAIESITRQKHLPIIVGGSNSYLEALIDDDDYKFRSRYDFCCLWVDVSMNTLQSYVTKRVDQMFQLGMVDELRPFFNPNGDYSIGIRNAIGVPEFHNYFRKEQFCDEETKKLLIEEAIRDMKVNTCKLARKQLGKIQRLRNVKRWKIHRIDATPAFQRNGQDANDAWEKLVAEPSAMIVANFLYNNNSTTTTTTTNTNTNSASVVSNFRVQSSEGVVAAATW